MKIKQTTRYLLAVGLIVLPWTARSEHDIGCSDNGIIAYGEHAVCRIDDENDQDRYVFDAATGDEIIITIAKLQGGNYLTATLFGPTGLELSVFNTSGLEYAASSKEFALAESGRYAIRVTDSAGGYYRLQVDSTRSASADNTLHYAAAHQERIDFNHDRDYYPLNALVNTTLEISLAKQGGLEYPTIRLFGPTGILLDAFNTSGVDNASVTRQFDVFESGVYTLEVSDRTTGIYELGLQCISGDCPANDGEPPRSLDFNAGMALCAQAPGECGIELPSVHDNLDIAIPKASFSGGGFIKADLRYNGDLTWSYESHEVLE